MEKPLITVGEVRGGLGGGGVESGLFTFSLLLWIASLSKFSNFTDERQKALKADRIRRLAGLQMTEILIGAA